MAKQTQDMFRKKTKPSNPPEFHEDIITPQLQWDAYKAIERQVEEAWLKLRQDAQNGAKPEILLEDRNRLMLLLAECNYISREWGRWAYHHSKKKAKPKQTKKAASK